uniref:Uncharacterized protein n=1 Tax=Timema tahoe TaxID=61484 RepID=A0A7R9IQA3_9NEOP|nr:unnamed protein product [Timema tahoe]
MSYIFYTKGGNPVTTLKRKRDCFGSPLRPQLTRSRPGSTLLRSTNAYRHFQHQTNSQGLASFPTVPKKKRRQMICAAWMRVTGSVQKLSELLLGVPFCKRRRLVEYVLDGCYPLPLSPYFVPHLESTWRHLSDIYRASFCNAVTHYTAITSRREFYHGNFHFVCSRKTFYSSTRLQAAEEDKSIKLVPYKKAVGTLIFISTVSCPDIAFAVGQVSKYCNSFDRNHRHSYNRTSRTLCPDNNYYEPNENSELIVDDWECSGSYATLMEFRNKLVTFSVSPSITYQDYIVATIAALVALSLFYLFAIIVGVIYFIRKRNNALEDDLLDDTSVSSPGLSGESRNTVESDRVCCSNSDSSLDETDIDMLQDADSEKDIFRQRAGRIGGIKEGKGGKGGDGTGTLPAIRRARDNIDSSSGGSSNLARRTTFICFSLGWGYLLEPAAER